MFPNSLLVRFGSDLRLHAPVAIVVAAVVWLLRASTEAARLPNARVRRAA